MCIMSPSTSVKFCFVFFFSFLLENHVLNGYRMLKKWSIHIQMYKMGGNSVSNIVL